MKNFLTLVFSVLLGLSTTVNAQNVWVISDTCITSTITEVTLGYDNLSPPQQGGNNYAQIFYGPVGVPNAWVLNQSLPFIVTGSSGTKVVRISNLTENTNYEMKPVVTTSEQFFGELCYFTTCAPANSPNVWVIDDACVTSAITYVTVGYDNLSPPQQGGNNYAQIFYGPVGLPNAWVTTQTLPIIVTGSSGTVVFQIVNLAGNTTYEMKPVVTTSEQFFGELSYFTTCATSDPCDFNVWTSCDNHSVCIDGTTTISAFTDFSGSGGTWVWKNVLTGAIVGTGLTLNAGPGTYTATFSCAGCEKTTSPITIGVFQTSPAPVLTATKDGNAVTVSTGISTTHWPNGFVGAQITFNQPGFYPVSAYYLDQNGCQSATSCESWVLITQGSTPCSMSAQIQINGNPNSCAGEPVTLEGKVTGASALLSYHWNTGANTSSITVTSGGNYSLTVTDHQNGCSTAASIALVQHPKPDASVTLHGNTNFPCGNVSGVSLEATYNPNWDYMWSTGSQGPSTNIFGNGNYFLTVTDSYGCSNEIIYPVTTLNIGSDIVITRSHPSGQPIFVNCPGDLVQLEVILSGSGVNPNILWYLWTGPGQISNPNHHKISIFPEVSGIYTVVIKLGNGCPDIIETFEVVVLGGCPPGPSVCTNEDFNIFPNPLVTSDYFTVELPGDYWYKLCLYAIDGRCVYECVGFCDLKLDVSELQLVPGVYVLKLSPIFEGNKGDRDWKNLGTVEKLIVL